MQVIDKNKIVPLLDRLSKQSEVFVPTVKDSESGFYSWNSLNGAKEIALEALNVYHSPKNVLFPQTERMYSIEQGKQVFSIPDTFQDEKSRIIFGIRACDAKAITCFDDVFLTHGYEDSFYATRRKNTIIIGNACYQPGANCFCSSMGINPVQPDADVVIHDAGTVYAWEAITVTGQQFTEQVQDLLEEKDLGLPQLKPFSTEFDYDGVVEKLQGMFDHEIWHELAEPCMNCGTCTYMCPSCHCFDIQVKIWGDKGYRFRCWDSCMYTEYTAEAGGGNPRPDSQDRFRNRFLHKLEFFTERYDYPLCTGCGRCISVCPNGINIIDIIKRIKEVDKIV